MGLVGITVFVVELEGEFRAVTNMGIDALGQLQCFAAGLLEGGDDVVVDLEMACTDIVDQPVAKLMQLFCFGQAALLGPRRSEACQLHVSNQQRLPCIQPVVDSLMLACQRLLGLFQFRQHNPYPSVGQRLADCSVFRAV